MNLPYFFFLFFARPWCTARDTKLTLKRIGHILDWRAFVEMISRVRTSHRRKPHPKSWISWILKSWTDFPLSSRTWGRIGKLCYPRSRTAHRWYTRNYGCLAVVTLANLTRSGGSMQIGQLFTKEISNHAGMHLSCIKYTWRYNTVLPPRCTYIRGFRFPLQFDSFVARCYSEGSPRIFIILRLAERNEERVYVNICDEPHLWKRCLFFAHRVVTFYGPCCT